MRSREDIRGLIALLNVCTKQELVKMCVEDGIDIEAYRERERESAKLLDSTRDYVDSLKRRADLIHAISDHVTENALDGDQLNAIAAIVWPACAPVDMAVDVTSYPTKLSPVAVDAMMLQASALLWNAHWFLKSIQNVVGLQAGPDLNRQIEAWRDRTNIWRHATGVEKHETDEVKAMPH